MLMAKIARPALNADFWPASHLASWQSAPMECFADWLAQWRILGVRQFRPSSRDTYTAMFSWWLAHLSAKGLDLLEATPADAASFFATAGLEPVSRRRYLQLLDRVYRHLRAIGWDGAHPLREELARERELDIALPPGLDELQLERLVDDLAALPGWKGARDRALAALLAGAGLRAHELIALPMGALTETFELRVYPGSVHRPHTTLVLPDGPWRAWLRQWLATREQLALPGVLCCPATRQGKPYSPSGLFRRVSAWLADFEDLSQSGPNLLRNTFARQALRCGRYTPEQVQEFLGHEALRATSRHLAALDARA